MNVFELFATLSLDSTAFDKGLASAGEKASGTGSKVGGILGTVGKTAAAATAAVATAAAGATAAIASGVSQVASYGDNIDKMSQKLGMSATAYQEWDAVMQHAGTNIDSMQSAMKTLASAAETDKDAFDALGLSQEYLSGLSQEELFSATITALQGVSDETERTYLAGQLLGRGATELGPLLNMTAEETQSLKDRVHEIGGVLSDEAVKAAAGYQDSLQDMQTAMGGMKNSLLADFLPSVTTVMDGLTELFSGGDGMGLITEGIQAFADQMTAMLPQVLEIGAQLLTALGEAIITNLPTIADAATETILTLSMALIDHLPELVEAGIQILLSLIDGIIDALPELIPALVEVITKITETLLEHLPELVIAGVQLLIAVATGVVQTIPQLVQKTPEIIAAFGNGILQAASPLIDAGREMINRVKEGVQQLISSAVNWGRDLIQNFINGIFAKWNALKESVTNVAGTIASYLHFSEPDEGPLSNFSTYAPDMMATFAQGIRDNTWRVRDQIAESFNFGGMMTGPSLVGAGAGAGGGRDIHIVLELDGQAFGRAVYRANNDETQRVGLSLTGVRL